MAFQINFGAVNQAQAGAQRGFDRNLQGFIGLGQQLQAQRQQRQQAQQQQAAVQEGLQALDTNNPQDVARFMTKYPGLAENIRKAWDFQTDAQQQEGMRAAIGAMQAYDAEGPEGAANVMRDRIERKMERGESIEQEMRSFRLLQTNPEQFRKSAEVTAYSLMDPEEYLRMKREQQEEIPLTPAQKDFNEYQRLRTIDPEGARQFGIKTGFIKPEGPKRLFQIRENPDGSITKFYSDGSEEIGNPDEGIELEGMRKPMSMRKAKKIMEDAKEGAKRSASFALRLRDDIDIMKRLVENGEVSPERIALINRAFGEGTLGNLTLNDAEQEYVTNARDAMYAILRPETGAAITDEETRNYTRLYLPQPGDKKRATDAKQRKMENQWKALRGQSGNVYDAMRITGGFDNGDAAPTREPLSDEQLLQKYLR